MKNSRQKGAHNSVLTCSRWIYDSQFIFYYFSHPSIFFFLRLSHHWKCRVYLLTAVKILMTAKYSSKKILFWISETELKIKERLGYLNEKRALKQTTRGKWLRLHSWQHTIDYCREFLKWKKQNWKTIWTA